MSLSNSVSFLMPPNAKVFVQAMSNAAFMQNVTLTPPAGTAAAFAGNGEGNVQMKLVTQGFLTAAGLTSRYAAFFFSAMATSVRRISVVPFSRCSGLSHSLKNTTFMSGRTFASGPSSRM